MRTRRSCILPPPVRPRLNRREPAARIATVSARYSFTQFWYARQVIEREVLVRKAGFLDARPQHDRLVTLVKGAVGLQRGGTFDSAAEILDVFKAQCLEQEPAGRVSLDRHRQQRLLVDPHLEPVVGDFAGLGLE